MAIIDEFPYPTDKPMAQELMRVLAALYRTEREALLFTAPFGVDPLQVTPNLAPLLLWDQLLGMLAAHNTVGAVVKAARDQFPRNPRKPFLDALLAGQDALVSAEPVGQQGPGFDDAVREREALLFFDDLTIPVGSVVNLMATLKAMTDLAPAVCLLRVQNPMGSFFGTGFRVGDELILTNHHVLFPKDMVATTVHADFGFDVDATGTALAVRFSPGRCFDDQG